LAGRDEEIYTASGRVLAVVEIIEKLNVALVDLKVFN
jgi:hypothetical protein